VNQRKANIVIIQLWESTRKFVDLGTRFLKYIFLFNFNFMLSDWISFLDYPNLFEFKVFVVVVVVYIPLQV
jgi:hypothetical protein